MRTNSFDFERALKKMERLRKNNRSQEEIIDDLKSELATINELSLLTHAMRLIVAWIAESNPTQIDTARLLT